MGNVNTATRGRSIKKKRRRILRDPWGKDSRQIWREKRPKKGDEKTLNVTKRQTFGERRLGTHWDPESSKKGRPRESQSDHRRGPWGRLGRGRRPPGSDLKGENWKS